MITTCCFLFFAGFLLWMSTSKRISWPDKPQWLAQWQSREISKKVAIGLFVLGTNGCMLALGVGSGLFAAVVILMMMGGVCVLFFPFSWLRIPYVVGLYLFCLLFELL